MADRSVPNPIRRFKNREKLTYPQLALRLDISEDYARKLGSDGLTTVSPQMALQFEQKTGGGITYAAVMRWIYDRTTKPEPESEPAAAGGARG